MNIYLFHLIMVGSLLACTRPSPSDSYSRFHSDSSVNGLDYATMQKNQKLIASKHPDLVEFIVYGQSAVDRQPLILLKIRDKKIGTVPKRPAVVISEGIHADEYYNVVDRLAEQLLSPQNITSSFREFLKRGGVVYLFPMLNPDGYAQRTRENKNDQDLNRDFPLKALKLKGLSQSETASFSGYIDKEIKESKLAKEELIIETFLDYHCCADGLIYPWGYEGAPKIKGDVLNRHVEFAKSVKNIFGYAYGNAQKIVNYAANGASDDHFLEQYAKRAFTFEGTGAEEQNNLPKHVEMWMSMFSLINPNYSIGNSP